MTGMTLTLAFTILALLTSLGACWAAKRARDDAETARFAARRAIELGVAAECHADLVARDTGERIRQWRELLELHMDNDRKWDQQVADLLKRMMHHGNNVDQTLLRGLQETQMGVAAVQADVDMVRGDS